MTTQEVLNDLLTFVDFDVEDGTTVRLLLADGRLFSVSRVPGHEKGFVFGDGQEGFWVEAGLLVDLGNKLREARRLHPEVFKPRPPVVNVIQANVEWMNQNQPGRRRGRPVW